MEESNQNGVNDFGTVNVKIKEYIDDQLDKKWKRWVWAGIWSSQAILTVTVGILSLKSIENIYTINDKLAEAEAKLSHIREVDTHLGSIDSLRIEREENSLYSGTHYSGCDGQVDYRPGIDQLLARAGFTYTTPDAEDSLNSLLSNDVMCYFTSARFVYFDESQRSKLRRIGVSHNGLPPPIIDRLREVFLKYFKNADVRFFEEPKLPLKNYVYFISRVPTP